MWQNNPLVRLAVPFVVGIGGAHCLMEHVAWRSDVLFVLLCTALMSMLACHSQAGRRRWVARVFMMSTSAFMVLLGIILYTTSYERLATSVDVSRQELCVVAERDAWPTRRSTAVDVVTDDGIRMRIFLAAKNADGEHHIRRGDTLLLHPRYLRSTSALTSDYAPDGQHVQAADGADAEFASYRRYLFFKGIAATCYVPAGGYELRSNASHSASWHERLHAYVEESALDATATAMVEALTIGERSNLDPELREQYAKAGVNHVLALSGMHLGILLGVFNLLIFRLLLYKYRRWAVLALIPLMWLYAYVAAFPPSLVRATVMATMLQVGFSLGRRYAMTGSLALAALLMLGINPLLIADVGFQLSFLSMLGIALVFTPLNDMMGSRPEHRGLFATLLRWLLTPLMLTVSTTLLTSPAVAYHFGRLPLYSLLSNLLVPLVVGLLMWAVFV